MSCIMHQSSRRCLSLIHHSRCPHSHSRLGKQTRLIKQIQRRGESKTFSARHHQLALQSGSSLTKTRPPHLYHPPTTHASTAPTTDQTKKKDRPKHQQKQAFIVSFPLSILASLPGSTSQPVRRDFPTGILPYRRTRRTTSGTDRPTNRTTNRPGERPCL